jgi:hypothetical protein
MALGSLTSQKIEAAPATPVALVQTSPSSLLPVASGVIADITGIIGLFGSTAATTETTITVTTGIGATAIGIGGTSAIAAC